MAAWHARRTRNTGSPSRICCPAGPAQARGPLPSRIGIFVFLGSCWILSSEEARRLRSASPEKAAYAASRNAIVFICDLAVASTIILAAATVARCHSARDAATVAAATVARCHLRNIDVVNIKQCVARDEFVAYHFLVIVVNFQIVRSRRGAVYYRVWVDDSTTAESPYVVESGAKTFRTKENQAYIL